MENATKPDIHSNHSLTSLPSNDKVIGLSINLKPAAYQEEECREMKSGNLAHSFEGNKNSLQLSFSTSSTGSTHAIQSMCQGQIQDTGLDLMNFSRKPKGSLEADKFYESIPCSQRSIRENSSSSYILNLHDNFTDPANPVHAEACNADNQQLDSRQLALENQPGENSVEETQLQVEATPNSTIYIPGSKIFHGQSHSSSMPYKKKASSTASKVNHTQEKQPRMTCSPPIHQSQFVSKIAQAQQSLIKHNQEVEDILSGYQDQKSVIQHQQSELEQVKASCVEYSEQIQTLEAEKKV